MLLFFLLLKIFFAEQLPFTSLHWKLIFGYFLLLSVAVLVSILCFGRCAIRIDGLFRMERSRSRREYCTSPWSVVERPDG